MYRKVKRVFLALFLVLLLMSNYVLGIDSTREEHETVMWKIMAIETALYSFQMDVGIFPATLDALFSQPLSLNTFNWKGPYLNVQMISKADIWDTEYVYLYPAKYGNKEFDLYSCGKNHKDDFGKKDDISNWGKFDPKYYHPKEIRRFKLYFFVALLIFATVLIILIKR